MFCPDCGKEINENVVCSCKQTNQIPTQQPAPQQPVYQQPVAASTDNSKIYNILSYFGIFWLIGMFANPEKNDPKVRFHVGQGIVLSILMVAGSIVSTIFSAIFRAIFRTEITFLGVGTGYYEVSPFGSILAGLVWLAVSCIMAFFVVQGVRNVLNGKEEPLPIIGKFSFYK